MTSRLVFFWLLYLCLCLASKLWAQLPIELNDPDDPLSTPGWHERSFEIDELTRWSLFYRPTNLPDRAPVVFLLHGGTGSMRTMFGTNAGAWKEWPYLAESEGFLLVVPNAVNPDTGDTYGDDQNWNDLRAPGSDRDSDADDISFLRYLIDFAVVEFECDPLRVYFTGASNGGTMSFRVMMELSGKVAAAATFIANLAEPNDLFTSPDRAVPLLMCNGTDDPLMLYDGDSGSILSSEATALYWRNAHGLDNNPGDETSLPDLDPTDECTISQIIYGEGTETPLIFMTVDGGGHVPPSIAHEASTFYQIIAGKQSHDLESAELAWAFFQEHSIPLEPMLAEIAFDWSAPTTLFNGSFQGGYPSGLAELQVSSDLQSSENWATLLQLDLNDLGQCTFNNVEDSSDDPSQSFFRVRTMPKASQD